MNSPTSALPKNSDSPLAEPTLCAEEVNDDPVIREVRDARHRLAGCFGNDLGKVAQDLIERQSLHGSRLLEMPPLGR